jgi:hypothetical protein
MRNHLIIAAAAVALSVGPDDLRTAAAEPGAEPTESAVSETARPWRIGDRPEPARWRVVRDAGRLGLPSPTDGGVVAALDGGLVELDASGAIARFLTI